ncbi:sugar MFS transporter [Bowmanella dokdonensis]|uniref:Sugar MFS transporter n=1 Tax=Bowmanella dokdonensis TaxID=751969 RepID=A0A939IR90_9ALTE|nr:sugar MFS transporter [Bowmanella dokdonensis]MBN7825256.1 sugar MFS transporter [Bowmanella dokdonensis]
MATVPNHPPLRSAGNASHFAFAAMTSLFFIWGFITALNDILIPHLKAAFSLTYTQAMLVQFCFFGAYFIVSPFAGKLIERIGYIRGIITGLCTIALGCAIFYPAAEIALYGLFLLGLFILAAGVTILQVSANPYVAILGPERTAASRLNLAQAINSLGHTLAPLFGAALIFGALQGGEAVGARAVQLPYLILAGAMLVTAVGFLFLKLPVIEHHDTPDVHANDSIWSHKALVFGALGIFLYVGAEVSIGSFLVNYFAQPHIAGLNEHQASQMVSYYWGGAMVGRFVGAALTRMIAPIYVLATNALMAIVLLITTINSSGELAMWSVIGVGFFNSIMFPTIFTLAIRGLGPLTGRGSGLLCQAIVGGAILPLIQGLVADSVSVQFSFIVPMLAYLYIGWYALVGSKRPARQMEVPVSL